MRLVGGMTVEELLDNSRPKGDLCSNNYQHWVEEVLESERDELLQWHTLNIYSGNIQLPLSAINELWKLEKAKLYNELVDAFLGMRYPALWDAAAFGLKKAGTCLAMLPLVSSLSCDEKTKRFFIWTITNVWQVLTRNAIIGAENRGKDVKPFNTTVNNGVDAVIGIMGRGEYERFLFTFDCYWANPNPDTFYIMVCEHLAETFVSSSYIHDFCNMNYLFHLISRCKNEFLKNKNIAQQLVSSIKTAFGTLRNSWPSNWETIWAKVYSNFVPIYLLANDNYQDAVEHDVKEVLLIREGWRLDENALQKADGLNRESVWLGLMADVALVKDDECLFNSILDTILLQYHVSDKLYTPESFNLIGLLWNLYEQILNDHIDWIDSFDKKILVEFNDFKDVACFLSRHDNYSLEVMDSLKKRWVMEKDVLEIRLNNRKNWQALVRWMQSVEYKESLN